MKRKHLKQKLKANISQPTSEHLQSAKRSFEGTFGNQFSPPSIRNPQSAIQNSQSTIHSSSWIQSLAQIETAGYHTLLNHEHLPEWFTRLPERIILQIIDDQYAIPFKNEAEFRQRGMIIDKIKHLCTSSSAKSNAYQASHVLIMKEVHRHFARHDKFPTNSDLARATGLSRQTVITHMKEFISPEKFETLRAKYDVMADDLMETLYKRGKSGDNHSARIFLQINLGLKRHHFQSQRLEFDKQLSQQKQEKKENQPDEIPHITKLYTQTPGHEKQLFWQDPSIHGPMPEKPEPAGTPPPTKPEVTSPPTEPVILNDASE